MPSCVAPRARCLQLVRAIAQSRPPVFLPLAVLYRCGYAEIPSFMHAFQRPKGVPAGALRFQAAMLPRSLYKAFDDLEHAEDLALRGRLRFSSLRYYQAAADPARRDGNEGKTHDGGRGSAGIDEERCFICSFTVPDTPSTAEVPDQFGPYLVRIDDPAQLLADAAAALAADAELAPHGVALEHGYVRYDLDEAVPPRSAAEARRRAWLHKDSRHRHEAEYRLMFETPGCPHGAPHHHIELGRAPRYARLIVEHSPRRRT